MSFFQRPVGGSKALPGGWSPPERKAERGSRVRVQRVDVPEVPQHRAAGKYKSSHVVERMPRGCLFRAGIGWFDLDGYWCFPLGDRKYEVRRGAPRIVMRKLTVAQKEELHRVRMKARRNGVR